MGGGGHGVRDKHGRTRRTRTARSRAGRCLSGTGTPQTTSWRETPDRADPGAEREAVSGRGKSVFRDSTSTTVPWRRAATDRRLRADCPLAVLVGPRLQDALNRAGGRAPRSFLRSVPCSQEVALNQCSSGRAAAAGAWPSPAGVGTRVCRAAVEGDEHKVWAKTGI